MEDKTSSNCSGTSDNTLANAVEKQFVRVTSTPVLFQLGVRGVHPDVNATIGVPHSRVRGRIPDVEQVLESEPLIVYLGGDGVSTVYRLVSRDLDPELVDSPGVNDRERPVLGLEPL